MKISILTLFPEMFDSILTNSILKRAISKKVFEIEIINIRNFTKDKHNRVDSAPIGGGAGLILKMQPLVDALNSVKSKDSFTILTTPKGKTYNQDIAKDYKEKQHIVIICGHYEGIDDRIENYIDESISIGDFIMTGGEIASFAIIDSIVRLLDGAISKDSITDESFEKDLLEYPQYTEPYDFNGFKVPDILYSGNHETIKKFRLKQSLILTKTLRPDLFKKLNLSKKEILLLNEEDNPKWEMDAIKKNTIKR